MTPHDIGQMRDVDTRLTRVEALMEERLRTDSEKFAKLEAFMTRVEAKIDAMPPQYKIATVGTVGGAGIGIGAALTTIGHALGWW